MKNFRFTKYTALLILVGLVGSTALALAASYSYRCSRCGLIQTYSFPAMPKCPNDGSTMFRQ